MKVLLCTNVFENITNGPAKFAHLALQIQSVDAGIEVRVLTEDVNQEIENKVYKLAFHTPGLFNKFSQFQRMFAYHRKAMHIHKNDFPFDVLIYNHALIGLWSALQFKNTWGFINDYNNAAASFANTEKTLSFSKHYIFYYFEKLSARFLKKIIVNSHYLKNYIITQYPAAKNKTTVFYKGIEFTPLQTPPVKKQNVIPEVLFVKNDYKRAGIFQLIEALKQLNRKVKLIVIGPYNSAKPLLDAACRNSSIELDFLGIQSQEIIYAKMQQADVFCVPSLQEGFGVANIEAMALACPVVTSTAGGIPEVMVNDETGWMTEPGNIGQLTNALHECLTNHTLRERKVRNGLLRAAEFSKQRTLQRFSEVLHDNL